MYDLTAIRNYELFGDHHQPDSTTTCNWARAEAAIDEHNRKVVEKVWRGIVTRVRARNACR